MGQGCFARWDAVVVIVTALTAPLTAAPVLYPLEGTAPDRVFTPSAFSPDGGTIVGSDGAPVRWRLAEGTVKLTSGTGGGVANAASTNATYIAGTHVDDAVRWGSTGPLVLGHLNPLDPRSRAEDITPDGAVVVGDSGVTNGEAFRWTAGGGMLGIGRPVGAFRSYARAVSHDGNVIAGGGQFSGGSEIGFRWTAATGLTPIPDLPGGRDYSIPTAISADGNVIVGISSSTAAAEEAGFFEAYRWTASAGTQPLGDLPGGDYYSWATDVTPNGNTVVGYSFIDGGGGPGVAAFIWDAAHGMRKLQTVLETEYGMNLGGWNLTNAYAISDDGRYIAGRGLAPGGAQHGWVVDFVPEPIGLAPLALTLLHLQRSRRRRSPRD